MQNCFVGKLRVSLKELMASMFAGIEADCLSEMLDKIPELNRRSYLSLLKRWIDHLGLNILHNELSKVSDTRHALAHGAKFVSADHHGKTQEYFRVVSVLDRVFLKLLDYDGYFVDVDLSQLTFARKKLQ